MNTVVFYSKNALRSASTTDILVNNENFNVAQFIRTEFANSPSFAATCRNVEDFCVAGVKLFVDKSQHKNLPWTYAIGGKSRNNAFIQLPTKFIEDICYTALVGTGFSENMADWSPDEDDVYKGACTRVGIKVQSSLGERRPSKSDEKPTPNKKFKSIIIDSGDENESVAE